MIERGQVKHDSQNIYYRSTIGAAEAGSTLELGITLKTKEDIRQVLLRVWREGQGEKLYPLATSDDMDAEEKFYKGRIQLPETGCLIWYYFIIATVTGTKFYGNNPEQLGGVGELYDQAPPSYQITVYDAGAKTPDWAKHAVMYQIFPDRFCRVGDKLIEKRGAVFHASWQDDPCYYKDPDTKEIVAYDFFGGNLRGIESKLPYLKDLGINTIYLNPVFESESNHHYDTGDYLKIDPILGTNDDFRHLVETAKQMGIRIILDGVFSHTGSNSRYFNRMGQYDTVGAYQSKSSPYYEWYNFRNFPNDYESWWNFDTLPDVKEDDAFLYGFHHPQTGQRAPSLARRGHQRLASRRHRRTACGIFAGVLQGAQGNEPRSADDRRGLGGCVAQGRVWPAARIPLRS